MTLGETIQEASCNWYQISEREAHFSVAFVYPAGTDENRQIVWSNNGR